MKFPNQVQGEIDIIFSGNPHKHQKNETLQKKMALEAPIHRLALPEIVAYKRNKSIFPLGLTCTDNKPITFSRDAQGGTKKNPPILGKTNWSL